MKRRNLRSGVKESKIISSGPVAIAIGSGSDLAVLRCGGYVDRAVHAGRFAFRRFHNDSQIRIRKHRR